MLSHRQLRRWGLTGSASRCWLALRSPTGVLCLLGLGSELVYLFAFTLRFPLPQLYSSLTDLPEQTGYSYWGAAEYSLAVVALFALYAASLRHIGRAPSLKTGPVCAFACAFGLTVVFLYPIGAVDMYAYLMLSRIWIQHGANPLVVPPASFPDDPLIAYVRSWLRIPSPYGPVWIFLGALPGLVAGRNLLAGMLLLKGVTLFSYLGCLPLIMTILSKVCPQARTKGLLFFAWNPLVVIEAVGNGHNDMTMMFFALLAVALALSHWRVLAPAALALSVAIKYAAAILVPFLLWHVLVTGGNVRERARLLVGAGGLAAVILVACYAPFWAGWDIFSVLKWRNSVFFGSPGILLLGAMQQLFPTNGFDLTLYALRLAFAAICILSLISLWRRPVAWLELACELTFAAMFSITYFNTWFLIWPLALAAATPDNGRLWRLVIFSFTGLMTLVFYGYVWVWTGWDSYSICYLAVPLTFLPPALMAMRRRPGFRWLGA